ncbi:extracellular solute-binding protein [Cohnella soli]|uniref:Extracellular solute-binding protein n=1 Tax=Cohnella soli TaxID=425005 RepID=A0ABW0I1T3_9BACL
MVLLTLLVSATVLSACGSGSKSNTAATGEPTGSGKPSEASESQQSDNGQADPLGKYESPVQVTIGRTADNFKFAPGQSIDKNVVYDLYEQKLGIKVINDWVVPSEQYDSKVNVAIASGNIPDMIEVNGAQLKNLVEADMIEDLASVYEKYASADTKNLLSEDGGYGINAGSINGKMYGLPVTTQGYWDSQVLWIRQDWLDRLKLEPPKTMDDVIRIAKAFTNDDPDGDGKNDTNGLGVSKDLLTNLFGFFNGYHAYPGKWFKDGNGSVVYGSLKPEMKEPLVKLADMYRSGIIDKEFGVKDGAKLTEAMNAGKIGMVYGNFAYPMFAFKDSIVTNPKAEWNGYPLPSADANPAKAFVGPTASTFFVVKKGFKNPEALVKMANLWVDGLVHPNTQNLDKEKSDADYQTYRYFFVRMSAPLAHISQHEHVKAALLANEKPDKAKHTVDEYGYLDAIYKYKANPENTKDPVILNGWTFNRTFGTPHSGLEVLDEYFKNDLTIYTGLKVASTETMAAKMPTLTKMEEVMLTKIIIGETGIEEFDKFVQDWNKLGGEQITKEVNE